jgi:TRAP-type uncharacterized transport system fused permease subunit
MAALLLLGGSTALIFLGMPVALSFIAINIIGAALYLGGDAGLLQIVRNSVVSVMNFSLTPIPLFILMGEVLFHTGLALKVIEGIERLIKQVPGRLAVIAVIAGTIFTAISGSTIATTAMLGSLDRSHSHVINRSGFPNASKKYESTYESGSLIARLIIGIAAPGLRLSGVAALKSVGTAVTCAIASSRTSALSRRG